jgi:hypothetical protein
MGKFCTKCGAALTGPFCVNCGADARNLHSTPPPVTQHTTPPVIQAPQTTPSATPHPARTGMSPLAKLGIAAVVIIFVGGAAGVVGMYYVAHRISQKVHEVTNEVLSSSSDSSNGNSDSGTSRTASSGSKLGSMGDVCRFLSKEDVSRAIGVEIIRVDRSEDSCSYIAKGTQADMTAKHVSAMMAARGADKKTQEMVQAFAGGMGKMFESEKPASERDTAGEVSVLNFSVDLNAAQAQMQLNSKGLSVLGDTQTLSGIGDEAFVSADGMIMFRKGKKMIRIMYINCPCNTEAVTPLAKEIAEAL